MENKFTKGFILLGLLTAAAVVGFTMSKRGGEFTKKMKDNIKPMAKHLKEDFGRLNDVTKEDFDELVASLVEQYAKKKEISSDSKNKLVSALKSKWYEIR